MGQVTLKTALGRLQLQIWSSAPRLTPRHLSCQLLTTNLVP